MITRDRSKAGINYLNMMFYISGILFLVLIVWFKGITVASAHALILMILFRDIAKNFKDVMLFKDIERQIAILEIKYNSMNLRLLKIEPYPDDYKAELERRIQELENK
jgi:hypothetical protein